MKVKNFAPGVYQFPFEGAGFGAGFGYGDDGNGVSGGYVDYREGDGSGDGSEAGYPSGEGFDTYLGDTSYFPCFNTSVLLLEE